MKLFYCPTVVTTTFKHKLIVSVFILTSTIFSVTSVAGNNNLYKNENAAVEKAVLKAMDTFQVPGIAVAIVKNNEVVLSKGFGIVEYGKNKKVNADTLFGIASNTKAMTTALIAGLVDEGKLSWTTKVIDIIPEFQMPDAYVTREFTVLDLLSHNSGLGLGAGDLMIWPETTLTTADIIKGLKYLPQTSSFRSEFAYDNLMYVIAGEIITKLTGKTWETYIQEKIFSPLGMKNTRAKYSLIPSSNKNFARAHVPLEGKLNVVGGNFLEKFSSAGAVASSVNDMSLWLKAQLNKGLYAKANDSEERIFSDKQSWKMWQLNTILPVSDNAQKNNKTHFAGYGLGWFLNDYQGVKLVHHSGGILGMVSKVVLVPETDLAMVILTNQQSGYAFNAIYHQILNIYLGLEPKDWVDFYQERRTDRLTKEKQRLADKAGKVAKNSKPSLALADYAQTYVDNWYGEIVIKEQSNKLVMQFGNTPELIGTLEHYQHNTFIVRWHDRTLEADAFVNFNLSADGSINNASMKAVSNLTDFSFDFHDLTLVPKK